MASLDLPPRFQESNVVLLAGGVGGAKLADGFAQLVSPERLTVIVNTGDDFHHLGLMICPDLDTVMYALANVANPATGWGRAQEGWRTHDEISRLNGPEWFRLGDLDLATHLIRSHQLEEGKTLTEATRDLSGKFGLRIELLPMTDEPAATMIVSDSGLLSFQEWFVARQWQPFVREVRLPDDVRASSQVLLALENADIVIIAPSNPFVSIDPILNVYPIKEMISDLPEMVAAVSPIVAGQAVKGPAAKMMREMGLEPCPEAIADHYGELIDVLVFDDRDGDRQLPSDVNGLQIDTMMREPADRRRVAVEILDYLSELKQ